MPGAPDVKEIFLAAAERLAANRAAYLDAACAGDVDVRRRVEALLKAHDEPDSRPDPRAAVPETASFDQPAARPGEQPGDRVGPYKLLQRIGEGGMGTVWMAEQTEPVRRKVAVKVIKAGMDSAQVIARFEAERQALALMDHPNIAKVLDAGTTGENPKSEARNPKADSDFGFRASDFSAAGRPYFVMELVKGVPITRYCDEHHLTPRERLELFVPVCQAVQHAHQKGVIHRDLKPSNVLVASYDDKPVPKVIDFGVAKAAGEPLTDRTMFTGFGAIVGTLEYMSPEQARLNALDIDTRTDVYALGVLLYELLTGTTPLTRKRLKEAALDELLRIIREEEPPRPSTRLTGSAELPSIAANRRTEPHKLGKVVRGELDWIVMKALEKDRSRRYETANGLARDLQRYLADEAVEACPPSAGYRLRKFARKHRAGFATAAAFAALLLLATGVSAWLAYRATWAERNAVAARDAEAGQRAEAERQRDEANRQRRRTRQALDDMLSEESLAFLTTQQELLPQQRAFLERALTYYQEFATHAQAEEDGRALVARAQYRLGLIHGTLGQQPEAVRAHRAALMAFETLAAEFPATPEYRRNLADSNFHLGLLLQYDRKTWPQAEAAHRSALALRERLAAEFPAVPEYRDSLAYSHNWLGLLLRSQNRLPEAESAHRSAVAVGATLVAEYPGVPRYRGNLAKYHNGLAILLAFLKKWPDQEASLRAALSLNEKLTTEFPSDPGYRFELATVYSNLGNTLNVLNKRLEAEAAYRSAVAVSDKLATDFPGKPAHYSRWVGSCNQLVGQLIALEKWPEAEAALRPVLAAQEKRAADFPANLDNRRARASSHGRLGLVLIRIGKRAEAEAELRQAVAILERVIDDDDSPAVPFDRTTLAGTCTDLGVLLAETGKLTAALAAHRQARTLREGLLAESPANNRHRYDLALTHNNLGRLLTHLGRLSEAESALRQAQALGDKLASDTPTGGLPPVALVGSYVGHGILAEVRGDPAAALAWYAKAIPALEAVLAKNPRGRVAREFLRDAHGHRATALRHLARPAEAVGDYDRALALDDGARRSELRLGRAMALAAQRGDHAPAVAEAEELTRGDQVSGGTLVRAAGVCAAAAAAAKDDAARQESCAARAVALLRRARAADYFNDGAHLQYLKSDPDLESLRGREDFQALVMGLEATK